MQTGVGRTTHGYVKQYKITPFDDVLHGYDTLDNDGHIIINEETCKPEALILACPNRHQELNFPSVERAANDCLRCLGFLKSYSAENDDYTKEAIQNILTKAKQNNYYKYMVDKLPDGTEVLKADDETFYDPTSLEIIQTP